MAGRLLYGRSLPAAAAIVAVVCAAQPAAAYIGPGAGISMIGALIGLLAAFGMALGIVPSWPVRVLLRRMRSRQPAAPQGD